MRMFLTALTVIDNLEKNNECRTTDRCCEGRGRTVGRKESVDKIKTFLTKTKIGEGFPSLGVASSARALKAGFERSEVARTCTLWDYCVDATLTVTTSNRGRK